MYVCVFISYVASRARAMPCHARAMPAAGAGAMRESHVGAHVVDVVSARAIASTVD